MAGTIMVPLDGSALAERALPYAARLARATGAEVLLFHTACELTPELGPEVDLPAIAERLQAEGLRVATNVHRKACADESGRVIAEAATRAGASLLIMASHGRGGLGRFAYGSVADQVLRSSERPVLLVSARQRRPWPTDRPLRILVVLDGTAFSEASLGPAGELARALGAELELLQVVEPPFQGLYGEARWAYPHWPEDDVAAAEAYLERLIDRRLSGLRVGVRALAGDPVEQILRRARACEADLVALATHGRKGLSRLVLGGVASRLLERAEAPLLVVHPEAVAEPAPDAEPVGVAEAGEGLVLRLNPNELSAMERGLETLLATEQETEMFESARGLLARLEASRQESDRPGG